MADVANAEQNSTVSKCFVEHVRPFLEQRCGLITQDWDGALRLLQQGLLEGSREISSVAESFIQEIVDEACQAPTGLSDQALAARWTKTAQKGLDINVLLARQSALRGK